MYRLPVLQSITSLQKEDIAPEAPSLAQSVDAVKEAIKQYRPKKGASSVPAAPSGEQQKGPQVISS